MSGERQGSEPTMNMIATTTNPLLNAAKNELMQAVDMKFDSMTAGLEGKLEAMLNRVCDARLGPPTQARGGGTYYSAVSTGQAPCCDNCAIGKPCSGQGNGCVLPGGNGAKPKPVPMSPGAPPFQVLPQCYSDCDCLDPCLAEFYEWARHDFDEWSWLELNKAESEIVHLNVPVGAGPQYQAALPLAATQKIIFGQELAQELPYQPGGIKIDAKWSGNPAPGKVVVNFYSGARGLTGITSPSAAGLILIGRSYTLADFECKDDCYLLKWPRLFGCKTSAIPHRRMIYVEFIAGADLGGAELTDLNPTLLKKGTDAFFRSCKDCGWKP